MRSWGLGHADCADDADFFFVFSCPTDFTDKHRFMPCAGRGFRRWYAIDYVMAKMTFTYRLDKIGCISAIEASFIAFDLRNLCVKIMQEVWRCEGNNVFL